MVVHQDHGLIALPFYQAPDDRTFQWILPQAVSAKMIRVVLKYLRSAQPVVKIGLNVLFLAGAGVALNPHQFQHERFYPV
jgi:hypothetical protein